MHELLVTSPAFPISDYEVSAIGDFETMIDAAIAAATPGREHDAGSARVTSGPSRAQRYSS